MQPDRDRKAAIPALTLLLGLVLGLVIGATFLGGEEAAAPTPPAVSASAETTSTSTTEPPTTPSPTSEPTTTTTLLPAPSTPDLGLEQAALVASGPVEITDQTDVVLSGLWISNPDGNCLRILDSERIEIRDSVIGPCADTALRAENVDGLDINGNRFVDSWSGIYALTSTSVTVHGNEFQNAGRNFVQFDKVSGPGLDISNNFGGNEIGASNAEDFVNLYLVDGTEESPVSVTNNYFFNGGPSRTGSGIMSGDGGGSHQIVANNTLVNPGQVGIGVASGTNITIESNFVYSARTDYSNVGLYVWEQYGQPCGSITVQDNLVDWTDQFGDANYWWNGGGCEGVVFEGNDFETPLEATVRGWSDG